MDVARWALNRKGLPASVLSLGGRFGYVDDGETPNTELTFFDYGGAHLIFEVRGLKTDPLLGARIGNIVYGTTGYVVFTDYNTAAAFDSSHTLVAAFSGGGDHYGNFLSAVRSGSPADLAADIEEGHLSSALCHLGNISYRMGALQPFRARPQAFGDDAESYATFARFEEHLAANGVRLAEEEYRLGPRLVVDGRHERFRGNPEADRHLTRDYRAPYVVPARI
jgi:hypothetical protein